MQTNELVWIPVILTTDYNSNGVNSVQNVQCNEIEIPEEIR